VGSQPKIKKTDLAYIAGFLDGDGSLMIQIKKRKDTKNKKRFMLTICFYQDSRHEKHLFWIRRKLKIGYISRRNDGITELRINGFDAVSRILKLLKPFLKFKKRQAEILLKASEILKTNLTKRKLKNLADLIVELQNINYVTRRKKSVHEIYKILGLTP